uniref:Uncharacterized protein n=1 Tax=Caenorhabditis japonica TaxID=281687 RepID=A0A8R1E6I3_CAEJA
MQIKNCDVLEGNIVDTLRMALNGNQLSILKSGHAILKGYQLAPSKVVVETEEFVAKFAAQIETDVMPTS